MTKPRAYMFTQGAWYPCSKIRMFTEDDWWTCKRAWMFTSGAWYPCHVEDQSGQMSITTETPDGIFASVFIRPHTWMNAYETIEPSGAKVSGDWNDQPYAKFLAVFTSVAIFENPPTVKQSIVWEFPIGGTSDLPATPIESVSFRTMAGDIRTVHRDDGEWGWTAPSEDPKYNGGTFGFSTAEFDANTPSAYEHIFVDTNEYDGKLPIPFGFRWGKK